MRRFVRHVPLIALLLAGAACGSGDAAVLSFSEVQASEFTFEADPTFPGRGIFRVTTTEPMICSITWGPTTDLGNQNNSLDMNGTGIIQHDVLLPGAEPGITYQFTVQGNTADGRLFKSEMGTFLIEAVESATPTTPPAGENLALGASIVEVSSEFGAGWAAANAVDGDLNTEWSTAGDGDDGSITIDLGTMRQIDGVEFLTRSMADGSATTTTFRVSVDGGGPVGPFDAGNPAAPVVNQVELSGQVVRFDIESSTGGNTGAIEVRVFGN